jgi:hypothetical protein
MNESKAIISSTSIHNGTAGRAREVLTQSKDLAETCIIVPYASGPQTILALISAPQQNVPVSIRGTARETSILAHLKSYLRWRVLGMKTRLVWIVVAMAAWHFRPSFISGQDRPARILPRNVVIFVFDGLRAGSVNAIDSPTMLWIRNHGVSFANSHSLFPTFTTANASAIATGHYLGDTGDYSNQIYIGHPVFIDGNFQRPPGSYAPYVENNRVLGDLDAQFNGNYLNEETLLAAARRHGFNTAAVGKMGPAAIQDVSQLNPVNRGFAIPQTIIIDDGTGTPDGVPLAPEVSSALVNAGLATTAPVRLQPTGNNTTPGTKDPNYVQQAYFADATTKVILPMFIKSGKPFALLYWSRDPDGTQHFQGDSLNKLVPGINGPTSKAALRIADNNLKQILDYINSDAQLAANTDIF